MYIDLLLSDKKDSMYAKIWSHADYFHSKFDLGSIVAIKGKIVKYRNRFKKATPVPYNATFREKEERWLSEATKEKYCTTFKGSFDLAPSWKCDRQIVINLFHRADQANVEFLNFKGSDSNENAPWDKTVVEALISMLERDKSHVYGINLGEIYFTQKALAHLYINLRNT